MKKICIVLLLAAVLTGCGSPVDYETMSDEYLQQPLPAASQMLVVLPPDAAVLTMDNADAGSIYLCNGYSVTVQTLGAGDLDATLRAVTGYSREQLSVLEQQEEGLKRYSCAWACAGEGGDQIGRAVILDDGNYHYALSLLAGADTAGELAQTWQEILGSVSLDIVP